MQTPARYVVKEGKIVAVYTDNGQRVEREVGSAVTANGRDLEAFERALDKLRDERGHDASV